MKETAFIIVLAGLILAASGISFAQGYGKYERDARQQVISLRTFSANPAASKI